MPTAHLAFDLGASSGRAIVGVLEGNPCRLRLEEVHRFGHEACSTPTGPVWNLTGIWLNLLQGLRAAGHWCDENNVPLASVGVDTWGVDWALVGKSGELLALPHCYRDPQNGPAAERVLEKLGGFERLYQRTGIQFMPFNSLFQIAARQEAEPRLFDAADQLLFLPDLFHYWLSGVRATDRTIASTSSMLNVASGDWDTELLGELGLPTNLLGTIVEPGTLLGPLRKEIAQQAEVSAEVKVIMPGSHDTASAVASVPATGTDSWAFLSSGTWSILGAELPKPLYSDAAREASFSNERGVNRSVRVLKNLAGLWLVQELQREWQLAGDDCGFAELVEEARRSEPFRTLVDPNDAEFGMPGDMAGKLRRFAQKSGQPEPESVGQLVRCCLESLALGYGETLRELERLLGRSIDRLHVVGGGTQNHLLSELTAAAVGRPVVTGPIEATAIGNLLVQAMGMGELADLAELRAIVARSFEPKVVESPGDESWELAQRRFRDLLN